MKNKKFLILFVTISFPVLLYLFLRFFGQNSYDLPIYFEKVDSNCEKELLTVSQDKNKLSSLLNADFNLIVFPDNQRDIQPFKNELARVVQEFSDQLDLQIISFTASDSLFTDKILLRNYEIKNHHILKEDYSRLLNCELMLPNDKYEGIHPAEEVWPSNEIIVLVDEELRIRGYYNGFETKEVDRLILELNVLLSKK